MKHLMVTVIILVISARSVQAQDGMDEVRKWVGLYFDFVKEMVKLKVGIEENAEQQRWLRTPEGRAHHEKRQKQEGLHALLQQAEQGDVTRQAQVAALYWHGYEDIVKQDHKTALHWYTRAADGGSRAAQQIVGSVLYKNEVGLPPNKAQALHYWRMAARQGDTTTQPLVAAMLYHGDGVPKNHREALAWFRLMAERGDPLAQHQVGRMLGAGEGAARNEAEAMAWYRQAAEQGYAPAQLALGGHFMQGGDAGQATTWLGYAAATGHRDAQFLLGILVLGAGQTQEANAWFLKAAQNGQADAQCYLGTLEDGQAFAWLKKAADQGQGEAMHRLALLYAFGRGGATQDFVQAHVYFNLAAAHRRTENNRAASAAERDKLTAHLTERQREKAQESARHWQPKPEPSQQLAMGPAVPARAGGKALTQMVAHTAQDPAEGVTKIQRHLQRLAYNPGFADGRLGPKTRDALRQFQTDYKLPVTGEPDTPTLTALDQALKGQGQ